MPEVQRLHFFTKQQSLDHTGLAEDAFDREAHQSAIFLSEWKVY